MNEIAVITSFVLFNCLQNNSVNQSHINLLLKASSNDIYVDFDEILEAKFEDFDISTSQINNTTTEITLEFIRDFSIQDDDDYPAYYALYTELIFTINMNQNMINQVDFTDLYNAIDCFRVEFFVDSDGF